MKADPIIISTGFFYSAHAWQLVRMAQSGHFNSFTRGRMPASDVSASKMQKKCFVLVIKV